MKDTDRAWLAGLIDGEGTIYSRLPNRMNVVVEMSMTCGATVQHVHSLFPGRLSRCSNSKGSFGSRQQYRWRIDTNGSRALLEQLLPFFVTKKRQAELALMLCQRPVPDNAGDLVRELRSLHQ